MPSPPREKANWFLIAYFLLILLGIGVGVGCFFAGCAREKAPKPASTKEAAP